MSQLDMYGVFLHNNISANRTDSYRFNTNNFSAQRVSVQPHLMMKHLLTRYAADKGPGMPSLIFGTP